MSLDMQLKFHMFYLSSFYFQKPDTNAPSSVLSYECFIYGLYSLDLVPTVTGYFYRC